MSKHHKSRVYLSIIKTGLTVWARLYLQSIETTQTLIIHTAIGPSHERKNTHIQHYSQVAILACWHLPGTHTSDDSMPPNLCCSRWLEPAGMVRKSSSGCWWCQDFGEILRYVEILGVVELPDHKPQLHSVTLLHQDVVQVTHLGSPHKLNRTLIWNKPNEQKNWI